jgi:hypothetical protein
MMARRFQEFHIQTATTHMVMWRRLQRILDVVIVAACLSSLSACQTEKVTTSDGWRMPPPPRSAPPQPPNTKADRMLFTVGVKPDDTNNNGYPDSIRVSVGLFTGEYALSIRQSGTFVFTLYPQGKSGQENVAPIAQWRVSGEAVQRAQAVAAYGPCYLFQLNLLEAGGDRLPLDRADMVCRFEPDDGSAAITSQGVRTIQIGRRMTAWSP